MTYSPLMDDFFSVASWHARTIISSLMRVPVMGTRIRS